MNKIPPIVINAIVEYIENGGKFVLDEEGRIRTPDDFCPLCAAARVINPTFQHSAWYWRAEKILNIGAMPSVIIAITADNRGECKEYSADLRVELLELCKCVQ